uniref:Esterase FrsA n=1 Tax=Arsenophonus endosymbiont of Trialeurodes vaporariorum TaxID=235567 RepID=A0A3B0LZD2_9GAMM
MLNRLIWIWRGNDGLEIEAVLSRIAANNRIRSFDNLLDTIIGYQPGNWAYEWSQQAMGWQKKALELPTKIAASQAWLRAANLYSIAAYPHLKGDSLAAQAVLLANKAYENAAQLTDFRLKKISFKIADGKKEVIGFLHLPDTSQGPCPTILVCGILDSLQLDYYRLFNNYPAPKGFAMLTLDMPSIGYSIKYKLSQDTSALHQQVLNQLANIPWIDHTRIGVIGLRFGANIALRLAYLEPKRLKGVAVLGLIVHSLLTEQKYQDQIPVMNIDLFASRLGFYQVDEAVLRSELSCYSLKKQGLLGRRCSVSFMAVNWQNDIFSPKEDALLVVRSSIDGKLLTLPTKPLYQNFHQSLSTVVSWLKSKIE